MIRVAELRIGMMKTKMTFTFIASVVASILMIINGLLVFASNGPLVIPISSFQVNATGTITANSTTPIMKTTAFWGRIALGIPGLTSQLQTAFWLILAALILVFAAAVYRRPRGNKKYSLPIAILSLASLPIGGGFYVGAILGLIGSLAGYEWPKPFRETFIGKFLDAAALNSKLYAAIGENPNVIGQAALVVVLVGFLSGIGNGLYTYNADLIQKGGIPAGNILLEGQVLWNQAAVVTAVGLIGMALIKWLILSLAIYWLGAKLTGFSSSYDKVARMVAFAYVPESLMLFLPVMFSNLPTLTFDWPMTLYIISRLWFFLALIIVISQAFEFSIPRALGVAIFSTAVYWVTYYLFIVPALNVPGVRIQVTMPDSSLTILAILGIAGLISMLLGMFSRRQSM
jgi:hypothetical protein